jgi:glycosyltransferase involved in cell wall biosynthesis
MNKPLNILFLASWFPNKLKPKNGNFIQQHALAVSKVCNVACLHALSNEQDELFDIEERTTEGVYEVIVYYKKINSNFPIISQYLKVKRQIEAYRMGYKKVKAHLKTIDLVHLNVMYPAGIFALDLKETFQLPYIVSEHWTAFLPTDPIKINGLEKYFIKRIMKNASVICPVSKDLEQALKTYYPHSKFEIIPNVVNITVFKHQIHEKGKRILHVSNLKDDQKNISGILDSIKTLSLTRTDFFITIAGDGDYQIFQQYAKKLQIPENLYTIEGAKSYTEVAALMQQHDLFLLYSNYENLPCVIAESLVSGLPVLSSKAGGTAEMVDATSGIIVEAKNNTLLIKQLNYMLDNIEQYNTTEIAKKAVQKYSYENVGKQFLSIYQKVLNR